MGQELTRQQKQAVEENGNLIVSAAAGAGKTFVLTQRVLRLVREGTGLENMLILTFTRAAAAEMKERIAKALAKEAEAEKDEEKKKRLKKQVLYCPNAAISTIDSFCASVVRRYYYLENLAPGMEMLNEAEKAVLLSSSLDAALTFAAANGKDDYKKLLRAFNGESSLRSSLMKLHDFLSACPDKEEWLSRVEEAGGSGSLLKKALKGLFPTLKASLISAIKEMDAVKARVPEDASATRGSIDKCMKHLRSVCLPDTGMEDYRAYLFAAEFPRFQHTKGLDESIKNAVDSTRKALKTEVDAQKEYFAAAEAGEPDEAHVSGLVCLFLSLYRRMDAFFSAAKLEKGQLDFADTEYYCLKILAHEEAAKEYRERFSVIIVDEYQDSNRLQETILNRIRREDGLFLVGDVKQSIYGFRNAEPSMFLQKTKNWPEGKCLHLTSNFRSSKEVLDAVNAVFFHIMTPETGRLEYTESEALSPGREQPEGCTELVVLQKPASGEEDAPEEAGGENETDGLEPDDSLSSIEAEALFCAGEIRELMNTRGYGYGDFTVLLRSKKSAPEFANVLSAAGIPCHSNAAGGLFDAIEVRLFMNLLRVIDNRRQDIPLASVLRSLTGGFTDDDLIGLRTEKGRGTLLDCLVSAAPGGRAEAFLSRLEAWRQKSLYMPMREFMAMLLDETGYERELYALPGGSGRVGNLHTVLIKAGEYDDSGAFGLGGFLAMMDKINDTGKLESGAMNAGKDVVRIMTVHGSKGLEFPVVFYCDLARRFNLSADSGAKMLADNDLGMAIKYVGGNVLHAPLLHTLLSRGIRQKAIEEEMRILYVGMTRAVRKLYLVGTMRDTAKQDVKAQMEERAGASPAKIRSSMNALNWVLTAQDAYSRVRVLDAAAFSRNSSANEPLPPADPAAVARFADSIHKPYPYESLADVPEKTSATDLEERRRLLGGANGFDESGFAENPFREETDSYALSYGTSVHALLRRLPLGADMAAAREKMLAPLSEKDKADIGWFLASPLFERMQASPLCRRELQFTVKRKSEELCGMNPGGEVLVQGAIDCCFTEGDGYVLLDYKTDRFRGRTPEETAEPHRMQAELYRDALETLTGMPVKEMYIVFTGEHTAVRL